MNETVYRRSVDTAWGSTGIIYCMFAIIGNGFLASVFIRMRRKQSVTDLIFLQLAILDCMSGCAGLFGSIFLVNGRRWFEADNLAGDVICYPAGIMWNMASLTTPLLLSTASIGRFLAVYVPFQYEKYFNMRVVKGLILYCWGHGFLGATISFAGPNRDVKEYQMFVDWGFCDQSISDSFKDYEAVSKLIYIMLFTIPVVVSCLFIITCNLLVALKILIMKNQYKTTRDGKTKFQLKNFFSFFYKRGVKPVLIENKSSNSRLSKSSMISETKKRQDKQRKRRETQAILMTILLSVNYLVCYIEIIHYYVTVSIGTNWEQSYVVVFHNVTYVYLWYYFSLFLAAGNSCLLQICFNPNVKTFSKQELTGSRFSFRRIGSDQKP